MSAKKERERRREERIRRESEADAGQRRQRLIKLGSAAGFLAIAAILVLVVISQSGTDGGDSGNLEGIAEVEDELSGIPQHGLVLGHSDSGVKLVEYGDLQCPVCKEAAESELPSVIESRVKTGEAQLEFRNFVVLGEESEEAAAAAVAAARQNRGWTYIEIFYRNQGIEGSGYVTDEFMTSIARAAGVRDMARWNRERRSEETLREVRAQTAEAEELGFAGTPSFAVKGPNTGGLEPLGGFSAGELESAIESAG